MSRLTENEVKALYSAVVEGDLVLTEIDLGSRMKRNAFWLGHILNRLLLANFIAIGLDGKYEGMK